MYLMKPYDDALQYNLDNGIEKKDRTGVGCISVAGLQSKYRLDTPYFPLLTKRKMYPKAVWAELLWVISGSTMNQDLVKLGANFWSKWCDESNPKYVEFRKKWGYEPGEFGAIYGWQLRHFGADHRKIRFHERVIKSSDIQWSIERSKRLIKEELNRGFDQLAYMVDTLKNDPFGNNGRRCMFNLWNPNDLDKMALPPCHFTYQAIPDGNGGLTGILTQRSCDFPVGVPANIQFYSALTIMLAQQTGFTAREFIHNTNDSHIYLDQVDQVRKYLARKEQPTSPKLTINKAADIFSYKPEDFVVTDYQPLESIKIPVAV
jgi:thymidylate synthase